MNKFEEYYKSLLDKIRKKGTLEDTRTGIKAYTLFGESLKIDLSDGLLPIVTGKKIFYDKAYHEYYWFVNGGTTTHYLKKNGIHWWDDFADPFGNLGKTYGHQLRNFNGFFDQYSYILDELRYARSRRAHISLWNPTELNETKIPVCYTGFTFVKTEDKLNMSMHFRSSDAFLGLPYDIIVGTLLLRDIAQLSNLKLGVLNLVLDDVHIYENHTKQIREYLKTETYELPQMPLASDKDKLYGYRCGEYIPAKLNV